MTQIESRFLYKYRGVDENTQEGKNSQLYYLKKQIEDDLIYFPTPAEFNDPFDCAPVISMHSPSLSYEQFEKILIEHSKNNNIDITEIQLKERIKELYGKPVLPIELLNTPLNFRKTTHMYCISATCKSILMWSHYASHHQGVCLEYERNGFLAEALPVKYKASRPTQFLFDTSPLIDQVKKSLLIKHEDWEYEKEWRVIENNSTKTEYLIDAKSLKRIILGANIKDTIKEEIINSANKRKYPPAIVQARLCEKTYSMVIPDE
ncbi:DUF2971 domain-containing protein [uncultured Deefgea sp.]|uniref:DUF2971 domain-containing protein n=1 Tax=uncultured Deefgea sp. TaxID=1304914 RepID=UPI002632113B|nr:DUF2971 domain-containing protein [uncultured Deefgea sp.]